MLDFKWYAVTNTKTFVENEAKFEDVIESECNNITEFGLFSTRNHGKVWLDPDTGIFLIGDKENKVELELLDSDNNVFKITNNKDFKELYRRRLITRKYVSYDCVPGLKMQTLNGDIQDYTFGYEFDIELFGVVTKLAFMYGVNYNTPQHMILHITPKDNLNIKVVMKYPFMMTEPKEVKVDKNTTLKMETII